MFAPSQAKRASAIRSRSTSIPQSNSWLPSAAAVYPTSLKYSTVARPSLRFETTVPCMTSPPSISTVGPSHAARSRAKYPDSAADPPTSRPSANPGRVGFRCPWKSLVPSTRSRLRAPLWLTFPPCASPPGASAAVCSASARSLSAGRDDLPVAAMELGRARWCRGARSRRSEARESPRRGRRPPARPPACRTRPHRLPGSC